MKTRLIIFICLFVNAVLSFGSNTAQPKIFALVVGISKYADQTIPDLKYADKDALYFAEFLKSPNAGAVPNENMIVLTNEKATRSSILKEIVQLIARSGPEDLFIFYFSGHGKNDILENSGYLLTFDSENENEAGTAIAMDDIKNKIDRSKAKMKISYIDACHAGLFRSTGSKGTAADNGEIISAYLSGLANASDGNVAFLASSARQQSLEDDKLGHGVFTYYLIKGLKGEADEEEKNASGYMDGIVTLSELQTYITHKIELATKYKQKPSVDGVYDSDFPLSVLKPSLTFPAEIAKRPKASAVKKPEAVFIPKAIETPADEKISNGMALAGELCYGVVSFINMTNNPITLYAIRTQNKGAGSYGGKYDVDIKIASAARSTTPRMLIYQGPWAKSIEMCNDLFDEYKFYFKKIENGKDSYAEVIFTAEARKKKYLVLSNDNLNFDEKPPVIR